MLLTKELEKSPSNDSSCHIVEVFNNLAFVLRTGALDKNRFFSRDVTQLGTKMHDATTCRVWEHYITVHKDKKCNIQTGSAHIVTFVDFFTGVFFVHVECIPEISRVSN